ncbi:bifunctional phosphopantothenoylcysteine decarboxylase/phosphopantothenate--cysteine ligase CoaBC [Parapedobacter indicus]|uniref:Coenzyme A biosynthesis bifunctional protein CoaBC n=1 Tax=Parapedobacter indicus TaxID=1477437 RepID=A0A1I3K8S9_9SPHI|nr:bifunctional phosphopantothenoylcysteine decarboxylase/phosphopantothenate--cysteine ligase CoaBC [Parapedobacter indicus]PPL01742.1 phosphopantothenoylcysteine decarboxylase/phosphopantothenate--cysteine ligase [Parapedobacter indicus]SFI68708.1 phosphopantothenoylcysteine decarboxylase / phosphopantothenate--cysteine ligase [Parapedobacter indicus]
MSVGGKHILLGVCGSIAAYKSAHLTRLLVKAGASVQVVMTPDATQFITPLTLATLSGNPVLVDYFDAKSGEWNNHVQLALDADALLVAPASANTLAKFAHGGCDNLLCAIYLSAKSPVFIAPAMDLDMWAHGSTRSNISRLRSFGNHIIPPANGALASGLSGEGRLAAPEEILAALTAHFGEGLPLAGKKALVSAGPTYEAIDPVRYIGNHSSGKMGYAIASKLRNLGADVTLVSGPSALVRPEGVTFFPVTTAAEMLEACLRYFPSADITIMSAAVADYTPKTVADQKIKKAEQHLTLELVKTTDILATLGKSKRNDQILVGFALETQNEQANALEKLRRKNLDFIVLNSMRDEGAGFAGNENKVTLIDKNGDREAFELKPKEDVAGDICSRVIRLLAS